MARKSAYALHEDYSGIPSFSFPFNGLLLGLVNGFLAFDRFRNRKSAHPRVSRREERIETSDGGSFKVIIMRPEGRQEALPTLIYYHGGAFALSYASMHLQFCERYAHEANCCVMVVDYRLGPSKPYPYGFQDCYRTLEWARSRASELHIDARRIAVGGDSAGGAMAAGVAQRALDGGIELCGQLLVYPVLDHECKTRSAHEFSDTPIWNAGSNRKMWAMYLRQVDQQKPPTYAAPARREDLSGLAPAYVETAEFDPLHDEGVDYARRLEEHGVAVQLNETRGTIHGYEMAPENPEAVRSLKERVAYLRLRFGN